MQWNLNVHQLATSSSKNTFTANFDHLGNYHVFFIMPHLTWLKLVCSFFIPSLIHLLDGWLFTYYKINKHQHNNRLQIHINTLPVYSNQHLIDLHMFMQFWLILIPQLIKIMLLHSMTLILYWIISCLIWHLMRLYLILPQIRIFILPARVPYHWLWWRATISLH